MTEQQRAFHLFVVDYTPGPRVFSPTLEDRSYVYSPNMVCGNKPVTIGHKYSIAAYLPEKTNASSPPWVVPLSCKRVHTSNNGELVGMEQIAACIQSQTPDVHHEETWWQLVMITYAQLYLARHIANRHPNPWETSSSIVESNRLMANKNINQPILMDR